MVEQDQTYLREVEVVMGVCVRDTLLPTFIRRAIFENTSTITSEEFSIFYSYYLSDCAHLRWHMPSIWHQL